MEICGLQLDLAWENRDGNFSAVDRLLTSAEPPLAPGSLLVLPEMFSSGFSMDVSRAADTAAGETEAFLSGLARNHGITVLGGVCRRLPDGAGANEAVAFDPSGTLLCRYRKIQPFSPSGEDTAFQAGDRIVTFPWNGFTVAPFICYDLRFPELFRAASRAGADLFCVIANWPDRRQQHKTLLLRARAVENQAFALGVNRTGSDPNFHYAGASVLVDPMGEIVAEAGTDPAFVRAAISPETTAAWRTAFPALRDCRSPEFYASL